MLLQDFDEQKALKEPTLPAGLTSAAFLLPPGGAGLKTEYYAPPAKKAKTSGASYAAEAPSSSAAAAAAAGDDATPGGRGRREKKPPAWLVEDSVIDIDEALLAQQRAPGRKGEGRGAKAFTPRKIFASHDQEVAELEDALSTLCAQGGMWRLNAQDGAWRAPEPNAPAAAPKPAAAQLDLPPWVWNGLSYYAPEEACIAKQAIDLFTASLNFASAPGGNRADDAAAQHSALQAFARLALLVAATNALAKLREAAAARATAATAVAAAAAADPPAPTAGEQLAAAGAFAAGEQPETAGSDGNLPAAAANGDEPSTSGAPAAAPLLPVGGTPGILKTAGSGTPAAGGSSANRVTFAEQLETVHPIAGTLPPEPGAAAAAADGPGSDAPASAAGPGSNGETAAAAAAAGPSGSEPLVAGVASTSQQAAPAPSEAALANGNCIGSPQRGAVHSPRGEASCGAAAAALFSSPHAGAATATPLGSELDFLISPDKQPGVQ